MQPNRTGDSAMNDALCKLSINYEQLDKVRSQLAELLAQEVELINEAIDLQKDVDVLYSAYKSSAPIGTGWNNQKGERR